MAYVCDNCRYLFPSRKRSCPFCGHRVYDNSYSEDQLLKMDYTWVPELQKPRTPEAVKPESNYLEELREAYDRQHSEEMPEIRQTETNPSFELQENQGENFFEGLEANVSQTEDIPTVDPEDSRNIDIEPINTEIDDFDKQLDDELKRIEKQRLAEERAYRIRSALRNVLYFFESLRWFTIFRIIAVLMVMFAMVSIWNMRDTIIGSIVELINLIMPLILTAFVIFYLVINLIRSMFR